MKFKELSEEQIKEAKDWLNDIDSYDVEKDLPLLLASFGNDVNETKYPVLKLINSSIEKIVKSIELFKEVSNKKKYVSVDVLGRKRICFSYIVSELSNEKYTDRFGNSSNIFSKKIQMMTNDGWEIAHVSTHNRLFYSYDVVYLTMFKFND